ncbi:hypothetical protein PAHAL_2G203200 [Panicum hallii]|uniref:Uncharacterized protein n=1 Tax=Panicum hallii TaxID=206008 RepID=A0A2S3GY01_9POAL|nr:hypothetical protein PAHAL_2G203200 [Panicum hallii]
MTVEAAREWLGEACSASTSGDAATGGRCAAARRSKAWSNCRAPRRGQKATPRLDRGRSGIGGGAEMAAERDIDDLPWNDANYTALMPL